MSSSLDRRAALNFTLRLVLRNSIVFLAAAVAFYVVTRHILYEALSAHWEEEAGQVRAAWVRSHADAPEEVALHVERAQVELSAALRTQAERRFERIYLIVAAALLVAPALGGAAFTYIATAPLRRIVRTVSNILDTGEHHRRVSAEGVRGTRNSAAEGVGPVTIYLLVPLLLPLFFTAVLCGLAIERPHLK